MVRVIIQNFVFGPPVKKVAHACTTPSRRSSPPRGENHKGVRDVFLTLWLKVVF